MTDNSKHIDNRIQLSFEGVSKEAPTNLWDDIQKSASLSEEEFLIKESYNNVAKKAPTKGWEKVKRQLIIDEVWENISIGEDKRKRRIIWWWISGSASIVILLISWYGLTEKMADKTTSSLEGHSTQKNTFDERQVKTDKVQNQQSVFNPKADKEHANDNEGTLSLSNYDLGINNVENRTSTRGIDDINNQTSITDNSSSNLANTDRDYNNLATNTDQKTENLAIMPLELISESQLTQNPAENEVAKTHTFSRFEIGMSGTFGNSWVLGNDVRNGFNRNSLVHNHLSLGYDLGFVLNYKMGRRSRLEIEYDLLSVYNQDYSEFENGRLVHNEITLHQQKMILAYKHSFYSARMKRGLIVAKGGGYFSHSVHDKKDVSSILVKTTSSYENFDFGISLGAGLEYGIGRFNLEFGLKTDFGVYNISKSSDLLPKKFKYTSTCIIGGYTAIRYRL